MEKITIFYKSEVTNFLNELVYLLFKDDYFRYIENAIDYKDKLIEFIENNISTFPYKYTPVKLRNLGSKYIYYKSNSRTTWYIFFEKNDGIYVITFITNNHSELAQFL